MSLTCLQRFRSISTTNKPFLSLGNPCTNIGIKIMYGSDYNNKYAFPNIGKLGWSLTVGSSMKQCCALTPLLLVLVLDWVICKVNNVKKIFSEHSLNI